MMQNDDTEISNKTNAAAATNSTKAIPDGAAGCHEEAEAEDEWSSKAMWAPMERDNIQRGLDAWQQGTRREMTE
jgi:hypothetical protein